MEAIVYMYVSILLLVMSASSVHTNGHINVLQISSFLNAIKSIISNGLLRHKQAKTNDESRRFGVIIMPLSRQLVEKNVNYD